MGISRLPPLDKTAKVVGGRILPAATDGSSWRWNPRQSLNSNSEMHMIAIYDARLIYGRGGFHGYLCAVQL